MVFTILFNVLVPDPDQERVDPLASWFLGVEGKLDARHLRETTLQFGVHGNTVLQTFQNLFT